MNRLVALLVAAALPSLAAADQRSYTFTYQAVTAQAGGLDLELYSTLSDPAPGSSKPRAWRHQVELEYGITARWDVSLYNVFRRPYGGELEYEAVKARTRYRVTEPGAWFVDVVAYLEAQQSVVDGNPTKLEEKLILAKDLGRANLAVNLVAEQEFEGGETALEWGYAAGASWEFHPSLRVGAESFGAMKRVDTASGRETEVEAWGGPAVSVSLPLRAGILDGGWLAVTAGFGLTPDSDDLRLRGILAFQF
jgi:hypothetical protein